MALNATSSFLNRLRVLFYFEHREFAKMRELDGRENLSAVEGNASVDLFQVIEG